MKQKKGRTSGKTSSGTGAASGPARSPPAVLTTSGPAFLVDDISDPYMPYGRDLPRDLLLHHNPREVKQLDVLTLQCGTVRDVVYTVDEAKRKYGTADLNFVLSNSRPEVLARDMLLLHAISRGSVPECFVGQLYFSFRFDLDAREFWNAQMRSCLAVNWKHLTDQDDDDKADDATRIKSVVNHTMLIVNPDGTVRYAMPYGYSLIDLVHIAKMDLVGSLDQARADLLHKLDSVFGPGAAKNRKGSYPLVTMPGGNSVLPKFQSTSNGDWTSEASRFAWNKGHIKRYEGRSCEVFTFAKLDFPTVPIALSDPPFSAMAAEALAHAQLYGFPVDAAEFQVNGKHLYLVEATNGVDIQKRAMLPVVAATESADAIQLELSIPHDKLRAEIKPRVLSSSKLVLGTLDLFVSGAPQSYRLSCPVKITEIVLRRDLRRVHALYMTARDEFDLSMPKSIAATASLADEPTILEQTQFLHYIFKQLTGAIKQSVSIAQAIDGRGDRIVIFLLNRMSVYLAPGLDHAPTPVLDVTLIPKPSILKRWGVLVQSSISEFEHDFLPNLMMSLTGGPTKTGRFEIPQRYMPCFIKFLEDGMLLAPTKTILNDCGLNSKVFDGMKAAFFRSFLLPMYPANGAEYKWEFDEEFDFGIVDERLVELNDS
ncbi:hypothetical protein H9P43_009740 [Blastocladiella emersonii ATCC 22665]|nr:hypothetical protein H9P43_009740 [Blastocladiella emersonii ATCC 22665]